MYRSTRRILLSGECDDEGWRLNSVGFTLRIENRNYAKMYVFDYIIRR